MNLVTSSLMANWPSLITDLSAQLAETKIELARGRCLNKQLFKQLNETGKELSDAVNKFSTSQRAQPIVDPSSQSLETPIRELSQAIVDLRRWLPESLASAATAAVTTQLMRSNTLLNNPEASALMGLYGTGGIHLPPQQFFTPFNPASMIPYTSVPGPFQSSAINKVSHSVDSRGFRMPGVCGFGSFGANAYLPGTHNDYSEPLTSARLFDPNDLRSRQKPVDLTPERTTEKDSQANHSFTTSGLGTTIPSPNYGRTCLGVTLSYPSISPSFGAFASLSESSAPVAQRTVLFSTQNKPRQMPDSGLFRPPTTASCASSMPPTIASTCSVTMFRSVVSPWEKNTIKSAIVTDQTDTLIPTLSTNHNDEDSGHALEAYEPQVDFKPVLESLPDLVDQRTGEENETKLFNDRARLYRWDKSTETWKTRGVGEVRILRNTESGKARLVMRRDQVKKICANHSITDAIKISMHSKDDRLAFWAVRDYTEELIDGRDEVFMIQFKSAELLTKFMTIFVRCGTKSLGKNQSDQQLPKSVTDQIVKISGTKQSPISTESKHTVDPLLVKFAPKPGSWDCPTCMLRHASDASVCPACTTCKPGADMPESSKPVTNSLFPGFTMSSSGFASCSTKMSTGTSQTTIGSTKSLFSFVASSGKSPSSSAVSTVSQAVFGFPTFASSPAIAETKTTIPNSTVLTSNSSSALTFRKPILPAAEHDSLKAEKTSSAFVDLDLSKGLAAPGFTFSFSTPNASRKPEEGTITPLTEKFGDSDRVEPTDEDKLVFSPVLKVLPKKVDIVTGEEDEELIFCERAKLYRWSNNNWRERGVGEMKLLRSPATGTVRCLMRRDQVMKVCCNHPVLGCMGLKPMGSSEGTAWIWWAVDFAEATTNLESSKPADHQTSHEIDASGGRRETFAIRFKSKEQASAFHVAFTTAAQTTNASTTDASIVDTHQLVDVADSYELVVVEKPSEVSEEQIIRAREMQFPDDFYSFENGHIVGEAEDLTATEEIEEDKLLEAAIKAGISSEQLPSENCVASQLVQGGDHAHSDRMVTPVTPGTSTISNSLFGASLGAGATSIFGSFLKSSAADDKPTAAPAAPETFVLHSHRDLPNFASLNAGLSDSATPAWSSIFGSKQTPSVWASDTAPMFTKPKDAAPTADTAEGVENTEDYDPHYDPVISLPEIVQVKSGEEDEICIFLRRCRVYRYTDGAWKERGVGDMKVMVHAHSCSEGYTGGSRNVLPTDIDLQVSQRARLLMRRDQVLKICVNQPISTDIPVFKPMGSNSGGNSMCWVGQDYSDGSASLDTLAVRFKQVTDADDFKAAVARAQGWLTKDSN